MSMAKAASMQQQERSRAKRKATRYGGDSSRLSKDEFGFHVVEGAILGRTIQAVTDLGDAIMFARTSDGGALTILVMTEGQKYRVYANDADSLRHALDDIYQAAVSAENDA